MIPLTHILILSALLFSNLVRSWSNYVVLKYSNLFAVIYGRELFEIYILQPITWHANQKVSELLKNLTNEIDFLVQNSILASMNLISKITQAFFIVIFLLYLEPKIAIISFVIFTTSYFVIFYSTKPFLQRSGDKRLLNNKKRYNVLLDTLDGIYEVKVSDLKTRRLESFSNSAFHLAMAHTTSNFLGQFPRYLMEIVAFGVLVLATLILAKDGSPSSQVLSALAAYALAGIRLLPAIQHIYNERARLQYSFEAFSTISNQINKLSVSKENRVFGGKYNLNTGVYLDNISINIPGRQKNLIKKGSFEILKGEKIILTGPSGSGKSSILYAFLGLIPVSSGKIMIDSEKVFPDFYPLSPTAVGYVPQSPKIFGRTIIDNITGSEECDSTAIKRASFCAQLVGLDEIIDLEDTDWFYFETGDNGSRLSGGQRQRIAIARAIFNDPEILVFDEATSALDKKGERMIIKNLIKNFDKKTLIVISHNPLIFDLFDKVYVITNGSIKLK